MNSAPSQVVPHRRWGLTVVFAVIAALPPLFLFGVETGVVARLWAIINRADPALPPAVLAVGEASLIVWAWAVFFLVIALVVGRGTEPERHAEGAPEEGELETAVGDPWADAGIESASTLDASAAAATAGMDEPAESGLEGFGAENLPSIPNLPEVEAWYSRGGRLHGMGRYEEAIVCYDKALRLHPRFASAWAGKGLASNSLGRYLDAIGCYDEALRLDPRSSAVWYNKGNTLCAVSRFEGALNAFNEALIIDPGDARSWHNKGVCLASLGRHDEAIPCYDKALELDPSYAVAWRAKAMVEERMGRVQDAVRAFKQFISLASDRDARLAEGVQRHVEWLEGEAA
jgi:tetratricopeptide (TPR) repeat protein